MAELVGQADPAGRDVARRLRPREVAGLPVRDAHAGFKAVAYELDQREGGLADLAGPPPAADLPPAALCSAPPTRSYLGWTSREPLLGSHHAAAEVERWPVGRLAARFLAFEESRHLLGSREPRHLLPGGEADPVEQPVCAPRPGSQ
jgi:hypothetical protein